MSVKFYLSPQENRFGECPVRVSVSIRGARLVSTVGYSISRDDWKNFRKDSSDDSFPFQTVVHDGVNASGIPFGTISSRIHDIYTHFSGYESSIDHKPSKEELSAELAKVKNGRKPAGAYVTSPTAVNYFDRFVKMESRRCEWSERTLVSWHVFREHLVSMGDNIRLEDFCNEGLDGFLTYLRKDCGMKESTVRKVFSELKWFLRWCIRMNYTDETAICEYDPKIMVFKDPIVFLTRDELLNMYNFRVPEEYRTVTLTNFEGRRYKKEVRHSRELSIVKDLFCFCSFTSLLLSELNRLKECNIQGDDTIVLDRRSDRNARLELNDYSVSILEKYRRKDNPYGTVFPAVSCQTMNIRIKELGELCGINDPVTRMTFQLGKVIEETEPKWKSLCSSTGRRTFINYALSIGIPPQTVMKMCGQSSLAGMKPFIERLTHSRI